MKLCVENIIYDKNSIKNTNKFIKKLAESKKTKKIGKEYRCKSCGIHGKHHAYDCQTSKYAKNGKQIHTKEDVAKSLNIPSSFIVNLYDENNEMTFL